MSQRNEFHQLLAKILAETDFEIRIDIRHLKVSIKNAENLILAAKIYQELRFIV